MGEVGREDQGNYESKTSGLESQSWNRITNQKSKDGFSGREEKVSEEVKQESCRTSKTEAGKLWPACFCTPVS